MSGILNKDLYGRTLNIQGFTVVDGDQNLCVENAKFQGNVILKGETTLMGETTLTDITVCGVLKTDTIAEKTPAHGVVVQHNLCLDSGKVLKINATQVVGPQQPSIGNVNTSDLNSVGNGVNNILNVLRAHGLIANIEF